MVRDIAGNQSIKEIIDMEMAANSKSFLQFGLEIEQPDHLNVGRYRTEEFRHEVPKKYWDIYDGWTTDFGGLAETKTKPYSSAAYLMRHIIGYFERKFPDWYWTWHSKNSETGTGCGSHIHFHPNPDYTGDIIEAWTITWNTLVELYPFLYPYFCWTRTNGFRNGASRGFDDYASPTTRRWSQASIREIYNRRYREGRDFNGITFNEARHGGKPLTIEMRANDNHPGFAIAGAQVLQSWVRECIKRGQSPKFSVIEELGRTSGLELVHTRLKTGPTINKMRNIQRIAFVSGREPPGLNQRYNNALELFKDLTYRWWDGKDNYRARTSRFLAGDTGREYDHNPANIPKKAWYVQGNKWITPEYMRA